MISVTITKFNNPYVIFTSPLGNGIARWVGSEPNIGDIYHVELDIDDYFEWGVNINFVSETASNIMLESNNLVFTAKVISYETDGILVVSLSGNIIFLEVGLVSNIDNYVSFFTLKNNVSLYPVEL
ncbi:hypothetical protein [Xenorhabdus japonica]|uniref:Uncharacterized protein n=1 Tax=Xenorhabdus japonica TaxID=53341 RepID=A0A1I4ZYY1_9GAMM|nr:hypothetical protein [Xenorhabdus japonica]SFN55269.1 hypothetical protein SAMN05421579_10870 [Xenorhabdus japonica]